MFLLVVVYNLATHPFRNNKITMPESRLSLTAVPGYFQQSEKDTDASVYDYVFWLILLLLGNGLTGIRLKITLV